MPIVLGIASKTLFIIKKGMIPLGQVRFDFNNSEEAIVSIAILKEFQGKGIATKALTLAIKKIKEQKKIKEIIAEIHIKNRASAELFKKLNFKLKEKKDEWLKYENKII